MKAIATIAVLLLAVFLVFGALGAPQYSSDATGATFTTSGTTIFDSWNEAARQRTERTRIVEAEETARRMVSEQEATIRNRDFWQMAPWVMLALAAVLGVVGGVVVWYLRPPSSPLIQVTVNQLQAPPDLRRFAGSLPIDAGFEFNGEWWVVDRRTGEAYQPPPHLARLPGPRGGAL